MTTTTTRETLSTLNAVAAAARTAWLSNRDESRQEALADAYTVAVYEAKTFRCHNGLCCCAPSDPNCENPSREITPLARMAQRANAEIAAGARRRLESR